MRYGKANEHNALVPRDHWLLDDEKRATLAFHERFPLEGYRRLAFLMLDRDVVTTSPSSVYRVLAGAGVLDGWNKKPSKKGTGFVQPLRPHEHWHVDIAYLNVGGTFYDLCSVLDGASRATMHWDMREAMTEADVECILQRTHEADRTHRAECASPCAIMPYGPSSLASGRPSQRATKDTARFPSAGSSSVGASASAARSSSRNGTHVARELEAVAWVDRSRGRAPRGR